uniref:Uncharacterized protein n=1 Tax=Anopheles merus TaxID=30066 RepID=A0A182UMQ8_ANOME
MVSILTGNLPFPPGGGGTNFEGSVYSPGTYSAPVRCVSERHCWARAEMSVCAARERFTSSPVAPRTPLSAAITLVQRRPSAPAAASGFVPATSKLSPCLPSSSPWLRAVRATPHATREFPDAPYSTLDSFSRLDDFVLKSRLFFMLSRLSESWLSRLLPFSSSYPSATSLSLRSSELSFS